MMPKEEVCALCAVLYLILGLLFSTPVQSRTCTRALDVVFLLDSGPDIPDDDWNLMRRLSRDVAYYLHPSTYGSYIAQVQFGGNTSIVHGLNNELVISGRAESFPRGRNLSDAIKTTRRLVLNNMDGDRPEVTDVIVLITHGLADDKSQAIAEARRVKSEGIRIIAVGMTSKDVDKLREELREIATDPEDVNDLMIISRNYYSSVFNTLLRSVCRNRVEAAHGSIRLVDGISNSGRLEVYIQEEWVTVCSNRWTDLNTRVSCKQMGFPDGRSMYTMNQTFYHRRIGIANIQCTGNEDNLLRCPHDPFFHINSSCDHQRDVFLLCLCGDCNDYTRRDNVRLADSTPVSGRLEVFSPGRGWGGVCISGWTASNTRVACRQLGFLDGAGTFQRNRQSITIALFNVRCIGNESSLFDCTFSTTSTQNCIYPIYIRCECNNCPKVLLQEPQQKDAMSLSTAVFEWHFKQNISAFEILFLSQKNLQTLIHVHEGTITMENTRFKHRIHLIYDDYETVGFKMTNITIADMGVYSLYVPELLLSSKAILIVRDFALVPDTVVHRQVHEGVKFSWDLTPLRQLRDINHEIFLTTPATGRIHLYYYYTYWLRENPRRHNISQPPSDHLRLTIFIDDVTVKDDGNYVIELKLTSSLHLWLNSSWQFVTDLVVADTDLSQTSNPVHPSQTSTSHNTISQPRRRNADYTDPPQTSVTVLLAFTIILCVMFALSVFAIILLIRVCRSKIRHLESKLQTDTSEQPQPHTSQPMNSYRHPRSQPSPQTENSSRFGQPPSKTTRRGLGLIVAHKPPSKHLGRNFESKLRADTSRHPQSQSQNSRPNENASIIQNDDSIYANEHEMHPIDNDDDYNQLQSTRGDAPQYTQVVKPRPAGNGQTNIMQSLVDVHRGCDELNDPSNFLELGPVSGSSDIDIDIESVNEHEDAAAVALQPIS